jgi:hypothetical protein
VTRHPNSNTLCSMQLPKKNHYKRCGGVRFSKYLFTSPNLDLDNMADVELGILMTRILAGMSTETPSAVNHC